MHVLVVSPIPSHPQNQGNSARIEALTTAIRALGAKIHFLYVALEGIDPTRLHMMRAAWDVFEVVDVSRQRSASRPDGWSLDDWYEPALDAALDAAFAERNYEMMIVNYVWFSRAFLRAPPGCLKVLDTHDVFGGRRERLLADGVKPTWYYTTPEEEGRGLDRADLIMAIQDDEAEVLAARSSTRVEQVGHLIPSQFLALRPKAERLRVGYIASGNPSNVNSLYRFCRVLKKRCEDLDQFEFVLAGAICAAAVGDISPFQRLGYLSDVRDLYENVDIVINPNIGGSGLKIKSVEGLSFGRPFIATAEAMCGIETDVPEHLCADLDEMAARFDTIGSLAGLATASRRIFLRYQKRQADALSMIYQCAATSHASVAHIDTAA